MAVANRRIGMGRNPMNGETKQKRLMILGTQFELCELVRMAKSRGYYTVVCDGYEDGPARELADRDYVADVRNIDLIADICEQEQIDHIITSFSDIMFECMVLIADKAGLPCYLTPDILDAYRRKDVTKAICRNRGIRVPQYKILTKDFTGEAAADLRYPCIVKPRDSYGSRGLRIVNNIEEVRGVFDEIAEFSSTGEVLVEEISKGQELNCTGFVVDGKAYLLAMSDRMTSPLDKEHIPVNYAQHYPSSCLEEAAPLVVRAMQAFVNETGQMDGPISIQCFYDGNQIEICEIAGRFFGFEHELVTMTTGLSIEELLLDLEYDQDRVRAKVAVHDAKGKRSAFGLYLTSIKEGVIADQSALENLKASPFVTDTVLFYEEGETCGVFGPKPYFARYYMTGGSREQLCQAEKEMLSKASAKNPKGQELLFIPRIG